MRKSGRAFGGGVRLVGMAPCCDCLLHEGRGRMVVILWRVDVYYPVTRVHSSTVHSAQTQEEAVKKALQHVPSALLEAHEYPVVQEIRVDSLYYGNPRDLVI